MGVFKGIRTKNGAFVTYNDVPLELRLDLKNHSPMGFEWGYNGSGPRQLALAILSKFISDTDSLNNYEKFYEDFVKVQDLDEWMLEDNLIFDWLKANEIRCMKPVLTSRFKLIENNDEHLMYLDNKKLGQHLKFSDEYNTEIDEKGTRVYCNFSEISFLKIRDLPSHIIFEFVDPVDLNIDEARITECLTLFSLVNLDGVLAITFWFNFPLIEYDGIKNPKLLVNQFLDDLYNNFNTLQIKNNQIDDGSSYVDFSLTVQNDQFQLQHILDQIIQIILQTYEKNFNTNHNFFEARFNFPEEYQGILKPYMLYFEEFLNDLCIETDVSIRREGLDAILSVEPKNKGEALEKIADALKAYLCAPVIADGISIDESLQMQTALTKLYAQCKHLESQIMYKDISLREQNQLIELKDNIINESTRILIEVGVNPNIITQKNTILLDSLKSITFKNKTSDKKTFFSSIKSSIEVPKIFSWSLELKRKEFRKDNND
ncbi:MAG: DUF6166 domain-containing protein [Sulfuricurvum sp.]|nr:DUF6166 domain-containing protein [Sulfuricurvum sp.]